MMCPASMHQEATEAPQIILLLPHVLLFLLVCCWLLASMPSFPTRGSLQKTIELPFSARPSNPSTCEKHPQQLCQQGRGKTPQHGWVPQDVRKPPSLQHCRASVLHWVKLTNVPQDSRSLRRSRGLSCDALGKRQKTSLPPSPSILLALCLLDASPSFHLS